MSIVFDRAIEYYDQTRSLPEDRQRTLIASLLREADITPTSRVLEIGIGTGRIAIDVAKHVRRLFGIDLSLEMMGVLRRKLTETPLPIDVTQANALYLPFAESTFDVAYAVHVYHLVHQWQDALLDARRVLKSGGRLVINFNRRDPDSPNFLLRRQMHVLARDYGVETKRPGAATEDEIHQAISQWDAGAQIANITEWQANEVPASILTDLHKQIFSETWAIPPDVMDALMPRLHEWAIEKYGDLSVPIPIKTETRWLIAHKN